MTSSGNFPLWSPLIKGAVNLSKGNTRFDGSTSSRGAMTSFAVPTGTKFYVECLVTHATGYNIVFGVANPEFNIGTYDESDASMNGILFRANNSSSWDTCSLTNGSRGSFGSNVGTTSARVLAMTINRVDNEIKMYLDNSLKHTISISATEVYHIVCSFTGGSNSAIHMNLNCGHDSTGAGDFSSGSATDENGFGSFQFSPSTEFLAPSSANLPIATELDPAEENHPAKYFDAIAYTGNGGTQNITGLGFQPDVTLIKNRDQTDSWCHQNSTLGVGKTQAIDTASAVASETDCVTAFNTDGFSLGSNHKVNASSENYIAYCWKKSVDAGLDIVTYSGDGGTQAVSHNLGVTPTMIWIFLNTGSNFDSTCYIDSNNAPSMGTGNGIFMSLPNGKQATTYVSATSSSSFSVTSSANQSGRTYFAYVWAEKPGFSRFTEYEGNGNSDGPFINNNFLGKLNIIKALDSSQMWATTDIIRETFNPLGEKIIALDNTYAEFDASGFNYDMLSSGIKIRSSDTNINSSASFLSLSWASVPFKYNNTL